jgi:hypothetical protein
MKKLQMKKRWIVAVVGLVALIASPTMLADRGQSVHAQLSGPDEVPSVSTTGSGEFRARLREDVIEFALTYEGLEGTTTTASHIHLGKERTNGGVIAFLCGGGGKPACTPTSGFFTGTITAADVIGPTGQGIAPGEFDEVLTAFRDDAVYANVHTNKHPGGEIRGQID